MHDQREHWVHGAARWFEDYWLDLAEALWPTFCTVLGLIISDEFRRMFAASWIGSGLCLALLFAGQGWILSRSLKKRERLTELRKEISEQETRHVQQQNLLLAELNKLKYARELRALKVTPLIYSYLESLASDLEFGARPHEYERLTLFLHNGQDAKFVPICRYSNSADFTKFKRIEYPETEGCLSVVWQRGAYCQNLYPDPRTSIEAYIAVSARDCYPRERVMDTRMKSRVYCGTVIWSEELKAPVGVLLFEASVDHYQQSALLKLISKEAHGHLGALIDARS